MNFYEADDTFKKKKKRWSAGGNLETTNICNQKIIGQCTRHRRIEEIYIFRLYIYWRLKVAARHHPLINPNSQLVRVKVIDTYWYIKSGRSGSDPGHTALRYICSVNIWKSYRIPVRTYFCLSRTEIHTHFRYISIFRLISTFNICTINRSINSIKTIYSTANCDFS